MGRTSLTGFLAGIVFAGVALGLFSLMVPPPGTAPIIGPDAIEAPEPVAEAPAAAEVAPAVEEAAAEEAVATEPAVEPATGEPVAGEPVAEALPAPVAEQPVDEQAVPEVSAETASDIAEPAADAALADVAAEEPAVPAGAEASEATISVTEEPAADGAGQGMSIASEPEAGNATAEAPADEVKAGSGMPEAGVVDVPRDSEFSRAGEDGKAAVPATEAAPETATAPEVAAPVPEPAPDVADVAPAPLPESQAEPPGTPQVPAEAEGGDGIAAAAGESVAESVPAALDAPSAQSPKPATIDTESATPPAPDAEPGEEAPEPAAEPEPVPEPVPEPAPEPAAVPEPEPSPGSAAEPEPVPEPQPEAAPDATAPEFEGEPSPDVEPGPPPQVTPDGEDIMDGATVTDPATNNPGPKRIAPDKKSLPGGDGSAPQPGFGNKAGVKVNRLPTIDPNAGEESTPPEAFAPEPAPGTEATLVPVGEPAFRTFAAAFDNPDRLPLLAVVLTDRGGAAGALDPSALAAFAAPLTVAIDPTLADAATRAAAYRTAGFEVAMLAAGIPEGATASDLEVIYQGWRAALPEAVGVVAGPDAPFSTNRRMAQHVVALLKPDGMALVTPGQGLNPAGQLAIAEGVPHAEVYRDADADTIEADAIRRVLDRAAFEARDSGAAVVLMTSRPEAVAALFAWYGEGGKGVILAPVTAAAIGG